MTERHKMINYFQEIQYHFLVSEQIYLYLSCVALLFMLPSNSFSLRKLLFYHRHLLYICISIIHIFFREIYNLFTGIRETYVYFDCTSQNGIEPYYCAALTDVPIVFMF